MKKVLVLMMSLMLCLGMAACGSKDEGSDSGASAEKDVPKVEKTVDAVAEALGLTDEKQEKAFEMVGATDGAGYGNVEIYIYDESSDAYKDAIGEGYDMMGIAVIKAAAYKDGVVLVPSGSDGIDQGIIDKFNELNF